MFVGNVALVNSSSSALCAVAGGLQRSYGFKICGAYFELDERHVIKNEKLALDRLRVRQNVFLV